MSRDALAELCETYWMPLYLYAKNVHNRKQGGLPLNPAELVQEFLAGLIEDPSFFSKADVRRKFRAYLLGSFKNFLANTERDWKRKKRPGAHLHGSLDADTGDSTYERLGGTTLSADVMFDRAWALRLFEHVRLEFGKELEQQSEKAANGLKYYKVYDAVGKYVLSADEHVPYGEAATQLDMTRDAVKTIVHRLRVRYRDALRDRIAQTLDLVDLSNDDAEQRIDEEMGCLLEVLRGSPA